MRKIYVMRVLAILAVAVLVAPLLSACGDVGKHRWGEWFVYAQPTCVGKGEEWRYREDSTFAKPIAQKRAISALGHDYKATTTAPTIDEAGAIVWTCRRLHNAAACTEAGYYRVDVEAKLAAGEYFVGIDNDMVGGRVSATPNRASVGTVVTLTVTPDAGYRLVEGSLKRNSVAIATAGPNAGPTFNMPATSVTIYAEFEEVVTDGSAEPGCDNPEIFGTWQAGNLTSGAGLVWTFNSNLTANLFWYNGSVVTNMHLGKQFSYREGLLLVKGIGGINNTRVTISGATMNSVGMGMLLTRVANPPAPPTKFAISVHVTNPNGVVSANVSFASVGDTITLTVVPAVGYLLVPGSLKRNGVVVSGLTFTMVAEPVVITAEFEADPAYEFEPT